MKKVRFDKWILAIGGVALLTAEPAMAASVSATSDAVRIDTRQVKTCDVGRSVDLPYDAAWCAASATADHGRVTVVPSIDAGATNQTSTVAACTTVPGTCSYLRSSAAPRLMRFSLSFYDSDGNLVGEELSADVAYQLNVAAAEEIGVDSRTNSLQAVAEAGAPAALTFDRAWVTNGTAASVVMHRICDRRRRNGQLESSVTNEIFRTANLESGVFPYVIEPGNGGTFTLLCSFFDADGTLLEAPLEASCYFKEKFGSCVIIK